MLIEPKTIAAGDVITMKLIGGDEVVAKLVEDNGFQLVVRKPMIVAMAQQGFGLMPYTLTAEGDVSVEISHAHVILYTKTIKDVASYYIQQTTGIIT